VSDRNDASQGARRARRPRLFDATKMSAGFVWRSARGEFLLSIGSEIASAGALAGLLIFGRQLVQSLTEGGELAQLADVVPATIGLGLALIVSTLALVFGRQARYLVAEQVTRHVEEQIVAVATSVDFERYEEQDFHDLLNRSNAQASQSSYQLVYDLLNVINVLATSVVVTAVLITTVPEVLGVLLLIAIPAVIAARASARLAFDAAYKLTPDDRLRMSLYRALTGKPSAPELRIFGLAGALNERWSHLYDDRIDRLRTVAKRQTLFNGLASTIGAVLVAGVMLVLVQAAISGRISLADAAVAIVALQQLTSRMRTAAGAAGSLRQSTLFLDDFHRFRALGGSSEPVDQREVEPLPRGELVIDDVSFRYPGTERVVLEDVSLRIAPGEIVALVGLSGGGKSTLAHLVSGLYRPTSGRITFGGTDIADISDAVYWRSLAVVFQDFVRYELTARENIAVSDHARAGDLPAVREAARRAGIADALDRLPAGLETMMSRAYEGGATLSVGQWQRVAVARAFFREAPLLVLDEPAAALDALAEQRLYERLVELCSDRSVLLISHRFSTVRLADRIGVMHGGRIIEQGTHEELMERGGRYAELFELQASGFLEGRDLREPARKGAM
jgi:ATP-binding cassette, subfamily B, bacterial